MDDEDLSDESLTESQALCDYSVIFSKLVKKSKKCGLEDADDDADSDVEKLKTSMMDIIKSCLLTPKQIVKLNTLNEKAMLHRRARVEPIGQGMEFRVMGKFSEDELTLLHNRWSTFCSEYGFDESEDLKIFIPNPFRPHDHKLSFSQREWFLQYLCQDFPDRDPEQVYQKFVDVFLTWKKGHWSAEEDDFLLTWYNLMPDMAIYAICAFVLHRRRSLVNRRLIKLADCCAPVKNMLQLKDVISSQAEVDKNAPEYPEWTSDEKKWRAIAAHSNTNRRLLMRKYHFQLNPALRAATHLTIKMEEKEVLSQLTKAKPSGWDSVDWFELGRKCNNIGAVKVYHIIRQMTTRLVSSRIWDDLPAVLKKLNAHKPTKQRRKGVGRASRRSRDSDEEDTDESRSPVERN